MNRRQRREFARHAERGKKREVERELKRRGDDGWSEMCTFDQHKKCLPGTPCACPHHERSVTGKDGEEIADVKARDSGIYVARAGFRVPSIDRGPRVDPRH